MSAIFKERKVFFGLEESKICGICKNPKAEDAIKLWLKRLFVSNLLIVMTDFM